ncbi:outer membrane protein assembly factor BamA [Myxococcota bacterium]|nr:outer membrane protein assembly factor BamA [Myxococcota bacterium]MBU1382409.1 outer membrane protein assembly factor BamA [Myxococcota bacterium]MBU1496568.1 outer membrane protein assembly factor BamA [Myxococcota bacterium]
MKFLAEKIFIILALVLVSMVPVSAFSQVATELPGNIPGRRVPVIDVQIKGNVLTSKSSILNVLSTKRGTFYDQMRLAQDVRNIWNLAKYSNIQVHSIDSSAGMTLIITVTEKPKIKTIFVHGNKELDLDTINKVVTLKPSTILDESAVNDNAVKIKQRYQEDGFYLARVKSGLKPQKNNSMDVHFYIEEGPRVKVGGVSFSGNKQFASSLLRNGIETKIPGIFSFLNDKSGVFKESDLKTDLMKIQGLYFNHGYIQAKVGPAEIEFSSAQNKVYIHIPIDEGKRFKIENIDISGTLLGKPALMKRIAKGDKDALRELKRLHAKLIKSKAGTWFNREKVAGDLKRLTTYYRDLGYAYVNVIPVSPIDEKKQTVSINFKIKPNKLVYIERIEIEGNSKTRDKVIRREIVINEGDLYSSTRIEISQRRIYRLGYFKDVKLKTRKGTRDDQITVIIKVVETSTGTFNIGAGFSTVENFLAQAQITQQNFLGRGQTLMLQGMMSSLRQLFTLRFIEPHFLDTDWFFAFSIYNSLFSFESFNRTTNGGTLTWGYNLTPFWRIYLTYKLEDVNIDTSSNSLLFGSTSRLTIPSTAYVANLFNDGITSSFKAHLSWDKRNNRMFPTKGWYWDSSVEVARPEFGSQNVFNRYKSDLRAYYPVWGPFVIKANAEIGLITSSEKSGVPIFERFFLGGINTIRGFSPYSIGPKIDVPVSPDPGARLFSFRKGGDKSLIFNLELEFDLLKEMMIKGVFFVDAGNAFDDNENYSISNLRTSWGFGLRWYTFLGILRFEWGIPFNPQPGERPIVFEFNIGNSF